MSSSSLANISAARRALAEARGFEDVKKIADTAKALKQYAKSAGESLETQNVAAIVRLEALRKMGEMLRESAEAGEREGRGGDRKSKSQRATLKIGDLGITKSDSSRWQQMAALPAEQFDEWATVVQESGGELTTAGLLRLAKTKPAAVTANTGQIEWYTPAPYIDAARDVMGTIDCDPASSDTANGVVEAATYYTEADDGLVKDWVGNVWLNPPYSSSLVSAFTEKLLFEIDAGNTSKAVVLVNNATDTRWFSSLVDRCDGICFTTGRIAFINPAGESVSGAAQGQVFLYFGSGADGFFERFRSFGWCAEVVA